MDIRLYRIVHLGFAMRKRVFMHMRTAKSQIAQFDQGLRWPQTKINGRCRMY